MYTREVILMDDEAEAGMQDTKRYPFSCGFPVTPAIIDLFDNVADDFGGVEMSLSDKNHPQRGVLVTSINGGKRSASAWVRKVNTKLATLDDEDFLKLTGVTIIDSGTAISTANTFRYANYR